MRQKMKRHFVSDDYEENPHVALTLHRKIGEGTYGKVYQSRFSDQIWRAVKILNFENFVTDMPSIIRELLVGGTCSGLQRSGVIRFLRNDSYGIVTKLGHCTLTHIANTIIPLHAVRILGKRLLESLHKMHLHRAMHRDLKPDNILITWETEDVWPKVEIIDYGMSSPIESSKDTNVVTLWWRAPEALLGFEHSRSVDIWSFGVILANMCSDNHLTRAANEQGALTDVWEKLGYPTQEQWDCPRPPWKGGNAKGMEITPSHVAILSILRLSLIPNPSSRANTSDLLSHSFWNEVPSPEELKSSEKWIFTKACEFAKNPHKLDQGILQSFDSTELLHVSSIDETLAEYDGYYLQNFLSSISKSDVESAKRISRYCEWPLQALELCVLIVDRTQCSGVFPPENRLDIVAAAAFVVSCLYTDFEPSPRKLSTISRLSGGGTPEATLSVKLAIHTVLRALGYRLFSKSLQEFIKASQSWAKIKTWLDE